MKKLHNLRPLARKKRLQQQKSHTATALPPPSQGAQRPQRGRVGEGGADN